MPGRGSETRQKSASAYVRMEPALAAPVEARAKSLNLTVAAWFRKLAVDAIGADPEFAAPTAPAYEPAVEIAELGRIARAVSMNNGAVVQLLKELRSQGGDVRAVEKVLAGQRAIGRELTDLVLEMKNDRGRDKR